MKVSRIAIGQVVCILSGSLLALLQRLYSLLHDFPKRKSAEPLWTVGKLLSGTIYISITPIM